MPTRPPRKGLANKPYHIHVGLGRLGLGLVLELLRPDRPLLILQRRSREWDLRLEQILRNRQISLRNSVGFEKRATVLHADGKTDIERQIRQSELGVYLMIYDRIHDLSWTTKYANSMTTAIGDQSWLQQWLNGADIEPGLFIFPFENTITLTTASHAVRHVIPDRICGEKLTFNDNCDSLSTEVEQFGHVVIKAQEEECEKVFAKREEILIVNSQGLFEFYRERKRRLVNGLHYVLATFGYSRLQMRRIPPEDWGAQYLPILIEDILNAKDQIHYVVRVLIGTQAIRLVLEASDLSEEEQVHIFAGRNREQLYLRICEYGLNSIARFKVAPDRLTRILQLSDPKKLVEKYREHVESLDAFRSGHGVEIDSFPARLKPWNGDIEYAIRELHRADYTVLTELLKSRTAAAGTH